MGLFNKIINSISSNSEDVLSRFKGVNFNYDIDEYPDGTDILRDFKRELKYHFNNHQGIKSVSYELAKAFIEGSLGVDVATALYKHILTIPYDEWLLRIGPEKLAMMADGKPVSKWKMVLSSENFKKWISQDTSPGEFNAFSDVVNQLISLHDEPYINWEEATIWNHDKYSKIKLNNMKFMASGVFNQLFAGVRSNMSDEERREREADAHADFNKAYEETKRYNSEYLCNIIRIDKNEFYKKYYPERSNYKYYVVFYCKDGTIKESNLFSGINALENAELWAEKEFANLLQICDYTNDVWKVPYRYEVKIKK
ncbi:MAG: hypothetical protein IJG49_02475 [Erysipelotrichaceae bacterium]|nr:hypothetical protein [Erysipelotrichaceae bacterium]